MASELKAICDRKATSGWQKSNSIVFASMALMSLRLPPYGRPLNVPAAQSTVP